MKNDLKSEYDSFLKSYEISPTIALRVNTLKLSVEDFQNTVDFCGENVPWCPTGFYYDGKRGNDPASIAGLFYSQEPSAQIAAELADIQKGDKVLDLCAAPGGKSTQLAAKLCGEGLLVSNEVNGGRAKILCENDKFVLLMHTAGQILAFVMLLAGVIVGVPAFFNPYVIILLQAVWSFLSILLVSRR